METIIKINREIEKMKEKHQEILDEAGKCGDCSEGMCANHRFHVDLSLNKNDVLYAKLEQTKAIVKMIEKFKNDLLSLYPLKEGEPVKNVFDRNRIKEIFGDLLLKIEGKIE